MVLVGAVVLVVVGILKAATWASDTVRSQNAQAAASDVRTTYGQPGDCAVGDLKVDLTMPDQVTAGQGTPVSLTLTNTTAEACLLDVGSASLGAVVTSGEDTVWTSTTCPAGATGHRLLVPAGDSASTSLTWDGRRTPATCGEPGAEVGAGTYRIRLTLGEQDLTEDRVFVVGASTSTGATTGSGEGATAAPTDPAAGADGADGTDGADGAEAATPEGAVPEATAAG